MNHQLKNMRIASEYIPPEVGKHRTKDFILALHRAVSNDELSINYQPRYDSATGQTNIFEALIRWHYKDVGDIIPSKIIENAIKFGLIYDLDLWVFEKCCRDLQRLHTDVDKNIKIVVNISPMECESLHHTQSLLAICKSYGLRLSDFEFEITESGSSHINDVGKVKAFCDTVIDNGASVNLDDFDTCSLPLINLCELPIDRITINKRFTDDKAEHHGRNKILSDHIINIAHEMKIKVVAKGIERASEQDQSINMGCDQLQGFYMCKPLQSNSISDHINMFVR